MPQAFSGRYSRPGVMGWSKVFKGPHLRITNTGALFFIFTSLVGMVAAISGNIYLTLVACFLIATLLLSALAAWLNLFGLRGSLEPPGEIFAKQPAKFRLLIRSPLLSFALWVKTPFGSLKIPTLRGKKGYLLPLRFPKRGKTKIKASLVSAFPLGLFEASVKLVSPEVLVYPYPLFGTLSEFNLAPLYVNLSPSAAKSNLPGEELGELSPYTEREPLSRIDWKATARSKEPIVRNFEPFSQGYLLDLDHSSGDREILLAKACYLVLEAEKKGTALGLLVSGRVIRPDCGPSHRRKLLEALALA